MLPLTPALCAQALAFDLDVNGRDYGRDFIRRRFVRRREVYLSGRVQHLLGYYAGRVVSVGSPSAPRPVCVSTGSMP